MLSYVWKPILVQVAIGVLVTGIYFLYRRYRDDDEDGDDRLDRLSQLRVKLDNLLDSLDKIPSEDANHEDEECIACTTAKVAIQTFPCGHKVLCRKCFVKTIQVAVKDLNLPLKCIVCRGKILTLDRSTVSGV